MQEVKHEVWGGDFGPVRVCSVNGAWLFSAKDVCRAIGYQTHSRPVKTHCRAPRTVPTRTAGGTQPLMMLPLLDVARLCDAKKTRCVLTWLEREVQKRGWDALEKVPPKAIIPTTGTLLTGVPAEFNPVVYQRPRTTTPPRLDNAKTYAAPDNTFARPTAAASRPIPGARLFTHSEFGSVRTVLNEGEPWFVASDVARALGYVRPRDAVTTHCKGVCETPTPSDGGMQTTKIIPESDVYRLIMRSKLPGAERFSDWVVQTVLPSIRKHGVYATDELIDRMIADPAHFVKVLSSLNEERQARLSAEAQVKTLSQDAEFGQTISKTSADVLVEVVAKELTNAGWRINRDQLFAWLRSEGLLCKSRGKGWNLPTMASLDNGYFNLVERVIHKGAVDERICTTTYVTGVGQRYIIDTIKSRYPQGVVPVPVEDKPVVQKTGLLSQIGKFMGLKQGELSL